MAAVETIEPTSVAETHDDVETAAENREPKGSETQDDAEASELKGDSESHADEEDMAKVLKQIEFYFTDSNLPYDRFMWTLHTANPEHWVPIATVASFKRTRQFRSKGLPWIADALRKSESLLEVDETGTKVRRREEVREPKGQFERSVYAKGFGDETPTLQDELEEFFGKYGKVNAVRMRRIDDSKKFKGSVFCEFANFDDVNKFLEADPKPEWNGSDLITMSKDAYCEMKIKEKGLTGKAAQSTKSGALPTRKGFNAFNLKDKAKDKGKKSEPQEKPEIFLEFMGTRLKVNQEDGGSIVEADVPFVKGASLKFSGCGGDVNFTAVKAPLKGQFERAPYIKYTRGEDSGLVGFDKTLSDEDIAFVRENVETINGHSVTWEVTDEDSERAFQIERAQTSAQHIISNGTRGASGGRRSRGVRHRGGGYGRGRSGGRSGRDGESSGGKGANKESTAEVGEKRKRAVEPDGGPDTKGQGIPIIQSSKKAKIDKEDIGANGS